MTNHGVISIADRIHQVFAFAFVLVPTGGTFGLFLIFAISRNLKGLLSEKFEESAVLSALDCCPRQKTL